MNKMLLILRREVLGLESPVSAAELAVLSCAIAELEHEAGRFVPTPSGFNRLVEIAIAALGRTAVVPSALEWASGDETKALPLPVDGQPARDGLEETAAETERHAAFQQLQAAQKSLRRLDLLLATGDGGVAGPSMRDRAAVASSHVDEAVRLLADGASTPESCASPVGAADR